MIVKVRKLLTDINSMGYQFIIVNKCHAYSNDSYTIEAGVRGSYYRLFYGRLAECHTFLLGIYFGIESAENK